MSNNVINMFGDDGGDEEFIVDHDDDGDGFSDSAELAVYEPPLPASILDRSMIARRDEAKTWLEQCQGALEYRWYATRYHGVRVPIYAARYTTHSGRGLRRVAAAIWHWTHDTEGLELRTRAAVDPNLTADAAIRAHAAAHEDRVKRIKWRRIFTVVVLVVAVLVARYGIHQHPWWTLAAGFAAAVALGMVGARRDEVIEFIEQETEKTYSAEQVIRAFFKSKIAPKEDEAVRVIGVPYKDKLGVVIRVELPEGITYQEAVDKHDKLASALHCNKQCLELNDLPDDSEDLIELFIADKVPSKVKVPHWPLMDVSRVDIFRPIPVGWTPRGDLVSLSLMWVHTLIGAAPRRGKTNLLRMVALATLLDPRAKLVVVDFGGGSDFKPLRPYCEKFIHGPGGDKIEAFLDLLGWLNAEYNRRQAALDALPISQVPEGRITPALAERPEFAPITVIVDEFQVATNAGKIGDVAKMGEEIVKTWTELAKVCPKVGITITKATQTADDSVPTELRNISLQRIALTMASFQASIGILGNVAHKLGLDASTLGGLPGLAYSWGTDSEEVDGYKGKLRFANVTVADAAALLERVAHLRAKVTVEAHNLPTGGAADEADGPVVPPIVTAALKYWPRSPHHPYCHQDTLAKLIGMDPGDLGAELRKVGLPTAAVRMKRTDTKNEVQRGYRLVDLEAVTR